MNPSSSQGASIALRVSLLTMLVNAVLAALKLLTGVLASSDAMISDAVHTISDVFSTLAVLIGIRLANKSADREHPYGHERIECLVALFLAAMLLILGAGIGFQGLCGAAVQLAGGGSADLQAISESSGTGPDLFNTLALTAALVSVAAKEWMYRYTLRAALQIHSTSLKADAWHHRSDALSSIGSFAGILGLRLGYPLVDSAASLVICFFICKASFEIAKSAVDQLIDRALSEPELELMRKLILQNPSVLRLDLLQTRMFGTRSYVDVEVSMDGSLSLKQAHGAAQQIHEQIEQEFPDVKHCMVHVNPFSLTEHSPCPATEASSSEMNPNPGRSH